MEDNTINQKVGLRMLQALGCRAQLAGNGEECLEAIRKEHFDLVLMDCQVIISPLASAVGASLILVFVPHADAGDGRVPSDASAS